MKLILDLLTGQIPQLKQFTHYIAQSQREGFLKYFLSRHFFSFMVDGTTDSGNLEDELIIVLYCKKDDVSGEIRSCARYLNVVCPEQANTEGLATLRCLLIASIKFSYISKKGPKR